MRVFRFWKGALTTVLLAVSFSAAPLMSATCSAYNSCRTGSCTVTAPVVSCHFGSVAICMGYDGNGNVIKHHWVPCETPSGGGYIMP